MSIMQQVKSSGHVAEFGYDEETKTLLFRFKGSGLYVYDDVPPQVHDELIRLNAAGESVGKYFQANIKNIYAATKVPAAPYHAEKNRELAAT